MADALSIKSRDFYEYAGIKMAFSLALSALGMYAMARLCAAGGQSKYFNIMGDMDYLSADQEDAQYAMEQGFGFGAFFYFLAAVFFWGGAVYVSPVSFGYVSLLCSCSYQVSALALSCLCGLRLSLSSHVLFSVFVCHSCVLFSDLTMRK